MSAMPPPKYSRVECIDVLSRSEPFKPTIREVHAVVHHLTPRAPFAEIIDKGRVKVGDTVRVCIDASPRWPALLSTLTVEETCSWRGIRTVDGCVWYRSWVRVKGGAA